MIRTDAASMARLEHGTGPLIEDPDEPVFVIKASDPWTDALLTCYEIMLKDDPASSATRRRIRRWQGDVIKWNKDHPSTKTGD